MKRIATALGAALIALGTAHAQSASTSPLYGELGYSVLELKDTGFKANPQALRGIIGYDVHPNLAVEGMAAFGTSDDSDAGVDVKVRNAYGVFLKPKVDIDQIEVFGRVGWVRSEVRASALGATVTDTDNDFSWGLGLNYKLDTRTHVGVDYMQYFDKDGAKINGWTVGVGYRF